LKYKRIILLPAIIILIFIAISGCGSSQIKEDDSNNHTNKIFTGLSHIGNAAKKAAFSPLTWVPAAALTGVYFSGKDHKISDWASSKTPVFGSNENANDFSNHMQNAVRVSCYSAMSARLINHSYNSGEFWYPALTIISSWAIAVSGTNLTTNYIKEKTGRERPDKQDDLSFVSLHASNSTSYATVAANNIERMPLHPAAGYIWQIAGYSLAAGTSWARVEAKKHFLTDVLAGWVLGHFISEFVCEALLPVNQDYNSVKLDLVVNPLPKYYNVSMGYSVKLPY